MLFLHFFTDMQDIAWSRKKVIPITHHSLINLMLLHFSKAEMFTRKLAPGVVLKYYGARPKIFQPLSNRLHHWWRCALESGKIQIHLSYKKKALFPSLLFKGATVKLTYHKFRTISRDFFLTLSTLRLIQRCGLFMDFSARGAQVEVNISCFSEGRCGL